MPVLRKHATGLFLASGSTGNRAKDMTFIAMKTVEQARFQLIDRLASILPDNTYLDELDIDPAPCLWQVVRPKHPP